MKMEILKGYDQYIEIVVSPSHKIEGVVKHLVEKGIILPEVARRFLMEVI